MEFIELSNSLIESLEAKSQGLPFSERIAHYKRAYIDNYIVRVGSGDTTYTSKNGDKLIVPGETEPFEAHETFQLESVREAIQRYRNGNTDYNVFLKELGEAGIHTFVVDLRSMKVIYQGPNSEYEYEEMITEA
ncbi:DUF1398 family protein [Dyadobacter tibetensis]|uniref:DUF1398 family protein n=1 Tax=Dyadobacter tibetensis TaxID=1211851 RepID=UPI0004700840|nr:DUF1398 family protein [Dyadobacter tibetensis]